MIIGENNTAHVKGPKGELNKSFHTDMTIKIEEGVIMIDRSSDNKEHRSIHVLTRSLLQNMVTGVSVGYTKELELVGVGYRANNSGQKLEMALGFSHNVVFEIPIEVKVETVSEKGKIRLLNYLQMIINYWDL